MNRILATALLAGCPMLLCAQQADPLASAECAAARAELEQVLNDAAAARSQAGERFQRAREKATAACLGRAEGGRERSGAPQPAQAVPPPVIGRGRAPALPALAPAPAPVTVPRPEFMTACDSTGCWDSEGRRLNNAGPLPPGPGPCRVQNGMVTCP